jgi:hypothetical protein
MTFHSAKALAAPVRCQSSIADAAANSGDFLPDRFLKPVATFL